MSPHSGNGVFTQSRIRLGGLGKGMTGISKMNQHSEDVRCELWVMVAYQFE